MEVLAKKAGQEVNNEIYYFKDKAGRDLGLRFDMTVPASCSPTKHAEAR
jgi:histidyl-tRNA synthetase